MKEKVNGTDVKDLTFDDIVQAKDIQIEPVNVPEWGGRVHVRSINGVQKERYLMSVRELVVEEGKKPYFKLVAPDHGVKLAALTMCDKDGNLLCKTQEQAKLMEEKSAKAMDRVVEKASMLNGLTEDLDNKAKNDSQGQKATN